jgi:hypothetical protein
MLTLRGNINVTGNLSLKTATTPAATSYLLDKLSAAPDVIMSPSKIFSSTYESTAIIRLRRTSDSAEQDFTGAEIAAGDDLTWIGSQTSFTRKIYDQSGNSKDAYQTNTDQQGQYTDASGNRIAMSDGNTAPLQTDKGMLMPALGFTGTDGAAVFRFNGGTDTDWSLLSDIAVYLAAAINRDRAAPSAGSGTPVIKINGTTLSPYSKHYFNAAVTGTDVTVRITDIDWSADSDWDTAANIYLTYKGDANLSSVALYNSEPSSVDLDQIVSAFEAT